MIFYQDASDKVSRVSSKKEKNDMSPHDHVYRKRQANHMENYFDTE